MSIDIYPIIEELEICKQQVDKELYRLSKKGLAERVREFNDSFVTLEKILEIIGRGLYKAAKKTSTEEENFTFYFWPGYTTINEKRVLIRGDVEKFDEKGKKFFTGIGFTGKEGREFHDCPSTLYFDAVMVTHNNFVPPSTHNWKRQQDNELTIKLNDESNLKILIIEKSNSDSIVATSKQVLHLTFDSNNVEYSVNRVSEFMDADSSALRIEPKEKKKAYIPWPLNNFCDEKEFKLINAKNLHAAQKIIYPIWFAATFCDVLCNYDGNNNNRWLSTLKNKLSKLGYSDLKRRIETFQSEEINYLKRDEYNQIHFKYWYSLFFDNYDSKQELGSAMFLSNTELPKEFLFYAIPWLKFMYSQIRGLDFSTQKEVDIKRAEWQKNFTKLHHSQVRYFEALKVYVNNSKISRKDKKAILLYKDILEGFLEVAKEMDDLEKYVESKGKRLPIDIAKEIFDSVDTMKMLFQNKEVALRSFKLKESVFESYQKNLENNLLFQGNFINAEKIVINSYPDLVRLLLKDLILNAISYCDIESPMVKIDISNSTKFIQLRIENNRIPASREELDNIINPDFFVGKYGIQIIKALKEALKWEMTMPTDYEKLKKSGKFYFCFKIPKQ